MAELDRDLEELEDRAVKNKLDGDADDIFQVLLQHKVIHVV